MKYKTTYFKISLNSEISVFNNVYEYRLDNEKLHTEIKDFEIKLEKQFRSYGLNIAISDMVIEYLEAINNPEHEIYKGNNNNYNYTHQLLKEFLFKKRIQRDLNEQRFTKDHEQELNNHLNEIAEDGWKLLSMSPVTKGYKDYKYSTTTESSYGYGYGHDVLEGFVLVWERIE